MGTVRTRKTRSFRLSGQGEIRYEVRRASDGNWLTIYNQKTQKPEPHNGNQITDSENHAWPPPKGTYADIGGPFHTIRTVGSVPQSRHSNVYEKPNPGGWPYDSERYVISGEYCTPTGGSSPPWPTPSPSSDEELKTAGATAISRCKPTSSGVEASTAVGELYREGIPHSVGHATWRDRTLSAKNAGSDYLNVKFGWQPLVSEILSFGSTVAKSRDILDQYRADKGKVIRRRYDFPPVRETSYQALGDAYPVDNVSIGASWIPSSQSGKLTQSVLETRSQWFSGAFVYGFPQDSTPFGNVRELGAEADRLFGVSLTPDVLWNLAPWSWAIDWFTNTGDVLSTLGDMVSQGLVMSYGYMMESYSKRVSYSLTGATIRGIPANPQAASFEYHSKKRSVASPFGFGVTWDGLSTGQAAILAALGISRR
jgi:hypothetical protein